MNIETLCSAIKENLFILKQKRANKNDHSLIENFQREISSFLISNSDNFKWETEKKISGRSEGDSIDIYGRSSSNSETEWIIEIDATRADQVAKKLLSRLVLWGLKVPIQYVAILYPDTQKGKNSCEKFLRYGFELLKRINSDSCIVGIFVDPQDESIEVLDFREPSHFSVDGTDCNSMNNAAEHAIKLYLKSKNPNYIDLKNFWGKFVNNERGVSRYKNTREKTKDGEMVFSYTQFRQYGFSSYWEDFLLLCKKSKIRILKERKLYIGVEGKLYHYKL